MSTPRDHGTRFLKPRAASSSRIDWATTSTADDGAWKRRTKA
jgi:hypothetical protein